MCRILKKISVFVAVGFCLLYCSFSWAVITKDNLSNHRHLTAPLFNGLDQPHYPIDTHSTLAQRYFEQGLLLFHGFDYAESIRSFQAASHLDPHCAMCFWGISLALGSKNNTLMNGHERKDAILALRHAKQLVNYQNKKEKALIDALSNRYSTNTFTRHKNVNRHHCGGNLDNEDKDNTLYTNALKKLATNYPNDIQIKNLYVAALFDAARWNFYTKNKLPNHYTTEIIRTLNDALKLDPKNPSTLHYYIHVYEVSEHPDIALKNANILKNLNLSAEHLVHMPAHIYMVLGHYHEAVLQNTLAIKAFQNYIQECRRQGFEPVINYLALHNLHFLWAAAMKEGNRELSLSASKNLKLQISPALLNADPSLQYFMTMQYFTLIQFGLWDAILKEPAPPPHLYYLNGIRHYARGMAFAHFHQFNEAKQELSALKAAYTRLPLDKYTDKSIKTELHIAIYTLDATLAFQANQVRKGLKLLRHAHQLEEDLKLGEPPVFYFETGLRLGYKLLEMKQAKDAERLFKQDLAVFPLNGWALLGLEQSLRMQNKNEQANRVHQQYKQAWQYADIPSGKIFS